jgi:hypothetical protein
MLFALELKTAGRSLLRSYAYNMPELKIEDEWILKDYLIE